MSVGRPGYAWISGYWHWNGGAWVWTGGHYEAQRVGYVWEQGRWERRGRGHARAVGVGLG